MGFIDSILGTSKQKAPNYQQADYWKDLGRLGERNTELFEDNKALTSSLANYFQTLDTSLDTKGLGAAQEDYAASQLSGQLSAAERNELDALGQDLRNTGRIGNFGFASSGNVLSDAKLRLGEVRQRQQYGAGLANTLGQQRFQKYTAPAQNFLLNSFVNPTQQIGMTQANTGIANQQAEAKAAVANQNANRYGWIGQTIVQSGAQAASNC
jgi:hypothetical protein